MLQLPLELQKAANGEFSLQIFSKEVRGESGAAAGCLQGVSCGGPVSVSHAHAGLGTNYALDLRIVGGLVSTRWVAKVWLFTFWKA